jgi:hypothetical protein
MPRNPDTPGPLTEGVDYVVEGGLLVFTSHYLLKRGYCCQNGCRNCPYGFTIAKPHDRGRADDLARSADTP